MHGKKTAMSAVWILNIHFQTVHNESSGLLFKTCSFCGATKSIVPHYEVVLLKTSCKHQNWISLYVYLLCCYNIVKT